jgi:chromosome segregation ATPase
MADVRWPGDNSPPVDEYETDALMAEAAAEIARLRAEVERLTRQVDHWIGCARATESHAARLEDRRADLAARAADLALKAQAVAKADRAALAHRVAEAVREACAAVAATHSRRSSLTNYNFTANTRDDQAAMAAAAFVHDEIVAIDLDTIVAAAIKKEGER